MKIPAGNSKRLTKEDFVHNETFPKVMYNQNDKPYCMTHSWASALCYDSNYKKMHNHLIALQCKKIYESPTFADDLIEITEKTFKNSSVIVLTDAYKKPIHFNPLTDLSPYPTLMILEGTDGGRNHAFALDLYEM